MITILIGGQAIDLSSNTEIEFEYNHPGLELDQQAGSYGLTVKVPVTPTNMAVFGHPDVIGNTKDINALRYEYTILFQGVTLSSGIARLSFPITNKSYSVYFVVSGFGFFIKDKKLTDYDWGGAIAKTTGQTATEWNDYVKDCFAGTHADAAKFCFPTMMNLGIKGVDDSSSYKSRFINYFHQSGDSTVFFFNLYSPATFVRYMLEEIFRQEGWSIDLSYFTSDPELNTLTIGTHIVKEIYAVYTPGSGVAPVNTIDDTINLADFMPSMTVSELINSLRRTFNLFFLFNPTRRHCKVISMNDIIAGRTKVINWDEQWDGSMEIEQLASINGYTFAFEQDSEDIILEDYLQKMFNRLITTRDHEANGWHILHFKGVDDKDVIDRQEATDALYDMRLASGSGIYYWCVQKGTIVAGQNDSSPWVTISGSTTTPAQLDFLFNLTASDYTRWEPLKAVPRVVINEPITLPTTADFYGEVAIIPTRYLYYAFYRSVDASGWAAGTDGYLRIAIIPHYDYVVGDGAMRIESMLRPLPMIETHLFHANTDGTLEKFRVPVFEQEPLMNIERTAEDKVMPKLMFYREDTPGLSFSYPYAGTDYYKAYTNAAPVGGVISFERDLHWEGVLGLYAKHWEQWQAWHKSRRRVKTKMQLDINALLSVTFHRPYR
jgi:hypothetical protein